jgi:MFS family permease
MTSQSPNINRWRAFALLAVAFFMTVVDLTIVNVSLPAIGRDLHFSETNSMATVALLPCCRSRSDDAADRARTGACSSSL